MVVTRMFVENIEVRVITFRLRNFQAGFRASLPGGRRRTLALVVALNAQHGQDAMWYTARARVV